MPDAEGKNTVTELKNYLGTPDRRVSTHEFTEFWKNLSEKEKEEFRRASLPDSAA